MGTTAGDRRYQNWCPSATYTVFPNSGQCYYYFGSPLTRFTGIWRNKARDLAQGEPSLTPARLLANQSCRLKREEKAHAGYLVPALLPRRGSAAHAGRCHRSLTCHSAGTAWASAQRRSHAPARSRLGQRIGAQRPPPYRGSYFRPPAQLSAGLSSGEELSGVCWGLFVSCWSAFTASCPVKRV